MKIASVAAAAALSLAAFSAPSFAAGSAMGTPSGTLVMTAKSADIGVGYTWGDAALTFNHKTYHFSITGAQIAAVGFSTVTSRGTVYNLHKASDFAGTYASATGEATVIGGLGGAILENKNGVRIKIESTAKGARLAAGGQGLTFTMK